MSNIRILSVEDDPIYAETIRFTVEQAGYQIIDVLADGRDALRIIESTKPDLLLLDIQISGPYNGIELAGKLDQTIPVIFITSLRERAIFEQAKKTRPLAFILKPFDPLMLTNTIELAVADLAGEKKDVWKEKDVMLSDSFFIKEKNVLVKVMVRDILYIKSEDKYCILHTQKRKYVIRISLKDLLAKVPSNFMQVHRSYVVDTHRISQIILEDFMLYIEGEPVPIGMSYKDQVLSQIKKL